MYDKTAVGLVTAALRMAEHAAAISEASRHIQTALMTRYTGSLTDQEVATLAAAHRVLSAKNGRPSHHEVFETVEAVKANAAAAIAAK